MAASDAPREAPSNGPAFEQRINAFCHAYGAFLVAAHQSFGQTGVTLPRPWPLIPGLPAKPWRSVLNTALAHSAQPDGMILEFGVYKGRSIRYLARQRLSCSVHGFDSFEGFPQDHRADWQQNFAVASLPRVPGNVQLHQGYFEQTLPPFLKGWRAQRPALALVHIDCDIFSSAHYVLSTLGPHLGPGDVIVFDELMNYAGFARNEFLALYLLLVTRGLDFEWLETCGVAYPFAAQEGRMMNGGFNRYRRAGFYQNHAIRLRAHSGEGHFAPVAISQRLVENLRGEIVPLLHSQAIDAGLIDVACAR